MEANFHDKNPRKPLGGNPFYRRTKYDHYGEKNRGLPTFYQNCHQRQTRLWPEIVAQARLTGFHAE
jgi:hypothetical protein